MMINIRSLIVSRIAFFIYSATTRFISSITKVRSRRKDLNPKSEYLQLKVYKHWTHLWCYIMCFMGFSGSRCDDWPSGSWGGWFRCRWCTPSGRGWTSPPQSPPCPPCPPRRMQNTPPCEATPAGQTERETGESDR